MMIAKMLWHNRMEPFQEGWSDKEVQYPGHALAYPKSGFWADPDLNALLWQYREAEIIQAVNRFRPLTEPVHVWLLTNIPLTGPTADQPGLVPDEIMSLREMFKVPTLEKIQEVLGKRARAFDPHKWALFYKVAKKLSGENGNVICRDLLRVRSGDLANMAELTIKDYFRVLETIWEKDDSEVALRDPSPGRRPRAIRPPYMV
jgi:hypothetical protein